MLKEKFQENIDKEYWLIPKRTDLHQAITFVLGISEKYNKKSWNASAQDRMGSFIAKKGATKTGGTITPQSVRTLLANIPQYFGFIHINKDTTPNTIEVTQAGQQLIIENKDKLSKYNFKNLDLGKEKKSTITSSDIFLNQFKKLQITNPIINTDCKNILVFPLYCTLFLLNELDYLSEEEIAIYLFNTKSHGELIFKKKEIEIFRSIPNNQRKDLVEAFKKSQKGNISLVQAPTTKYFFTLCLLTDLFKRKNNILEINKSKSEVISKILNNYKNYECFDFKENRELWISYFGNPDVIRLPKYYRIVNNLNVDIYYEVIRSKKVISSGLIPHKGKSIFPIIDKIDNNLSVFSFENNDQKEIINEKINFDKSETIIKENNKIPKKEIDLNYIANQILNHIESKNFDISFLKKLKFLQIKLNRSLTDNKNLRGARLEHLFYLLLKELQKLKIIDEDPIWHGKLDEQGLPVSAPGGKLGRSDIIFFIDNYQIVLELTTIKSKSAQEKAEAFSVPDHVKNHSNDFKDKKTIGFYLAPIHHQRILTRMNVKVKNENAILQAETIDKFLIIVKNIRTKSEFIKILENYYE